MDKSKNKYSFLLSNTVLFFISSFSSKFLTFLLMPIYTSVLLPGDYNTVDLVTQTANLLIPLVSLGVPNSIIRFGLDKKYPKKGVFTVAALCYGFGYLVLLAFYPAIVKITFISHYVKYLYLYLLCSCLRTLVQQYTRAKTYTRLYAVDGLLATVSTLMLTYLFLVKFHLGAEGYILAIIGSDFISFLFLSAVGSCWKSFGFKYADKNLAKEMLSFCLPLIPTGVFWWITNVSDRYLVTYMVSSAVSGIYAISYKIPSIVNLFSTIFTEAWQISAVQEGENKGSQKFFKNVFKAYQSVIFMAGAFLILICRFITKFMVADRYYESWKFMPVLIMATVFSCFSGFLSSIYMVEKNGNANLITMMAGAFSNIGMNLVMIPKWGAQGAAIATMLSYMIVFVLRAIGTKKVIDIDVSPVFIAANTRLMCLLSYCMVNVVENWQVKCGFVAAVIVAINILPIIGFAKRILKSLLKRRKKST